LASSSNPVEVSVLVSLLLALAASAIVTQIAVFTTTIYLHRSATHRSITLHPVVSWLCRFMLWTTTGIIPREWVAVHRKHHAFADQEGDPHSPHLEGFWRVQFGNVFYYAKEARQPAIVEKYAKDLRPDLWDRVLFDHGLIGLGLGIIFLCAVLGIWWGLLASVLHAVTYVFVLSPSINGLCHYFGYKNFDNTATNLRVVALLTGGEGLHNNHHGFPRSPKFSFGRRELDPAWPVIWLLTRLRLAKPYKTIEQHLASGETLAPQES
jgi:stearoyl-CoA desaturase (delta-9 desaturase)